ncbi:MAG: hypothetical protein ACHBN1_10835 [Heteroscytonema crispum UTEX LB 1556]
MQVYRSTHQTANIHQAQTVQTDTAMGMAVICLPILFVLSISIYKKICKKYRAAVLLKQIKILENSWNKSCVKNSDRGY